MNTLSTQISDTCILEHAPQKCEKRQTCLPDMNVWSRTILWMLELLEGRPGRWYILPTSAGQFPRKLMCHLGQRIPTQISSFFCQHSWTYLSHLSMFLVLFLFWCVFRTKPQLQCFVGESWRSPAPTLAGLDILNFPVRCLGQTSKSADSSYACSCHRLCSH